MAAPEAPAHHREAVPAVLADARAGALPEAQVVVSVALAVAGEVDAPAAALEVLGAAAGAQAAASAAEAEAAVAALAEASEADGSDGLAAIINPLENHQVLLYI